MLREREDSDPFLKGARGLILRFRLPVKIVLTQFVFVAAFLGAFILRFEFFVPVEMRHVFLGVIPVLLLAKSAAFLLTGQFRGWWRYLSVRDAVPILLASVLASVFFVVAVVLLPGPQHLPRSVFIIDFGLTYILVAGGRLSVRLLRESYGDGRVGVRRNVLVVGAGVAGQQIVREIRDNETLGMNAVGFVDDDPAKIGTRIHGLKVLGGHGDIETVCVQNRIDEVIVAIPSAKPSRMRNIVERCEEAGVRARILPGMGELIGGTVSVRSLRNVRIEDLLGRDPIELDTELLRKEIQGRVVLVSGAAGSIGSELCRQVALRDPACLVLFEFSESALFSLEASLRERFPRLSLVAAIGDVRDVARVESVFREQKPHIVYHAAAYKHVPMMEENPPEAVKNNIEGTRIVAEAAAKVGVARFVLVSSDKAVRPTNVMGATKRVAELIVQEMNLRQTGTIFVAVRFGNVLGSVGSVVPIFHRQLATTGRLTVTHQDASRYFMMIPEAAGLILQAGAMAEGGEVFVLEMGEPVKIVDLAKEMIHLAGREIGVNAEIEFIGLRPGEKLHEELVIEGEDVVRTGHPKVMKMVGEPPVPPNWRERLDTLCASAHAGKRPEVVRLLDRMVHGYTPDYAFHGIAAPESKPVADQSPRSLH